MTATEYVVTVAVAAVAFGPVMLLAAVLWWPLSDRGERRRSE